MSETKSENLLAGSTRKVQAGAKSLPVMKDGNETPDMLLALLNSPLQSMIANNSAKIMGKCLTKSGRVATIIFIYDAVPTNANTLQPVGKVEK